LQNAIRESAELVVVVEEERLPSDTTTMASILTASPVLQQLSSASFLSSLTNIVPSRLHKAIRNAIVSALQAGPLPRHIAFILDGNRRFARQRGRSAVDGHSEGREALKRVSSKYKMHFNSPPAD
jgi:hypothetical protein